MSRISQSLRRLKKYQVETRQRNQLLKDNVLNANEKLIVSNKKIDKLHTNKSMNRLDQLMSNLALSQIFQSSSSEFLFLERARKEIVDSPHTSNELKVTHTTIEKKKKQSRTRNSASISRTLLQIAGMEITHLKRLLENIFESNNIDARKSMIPMRPAQASLESQLAVEQIIDHPVQSEMHQQLRDELQREELKLDVRKEKLRQQKEIIKFVVRVVREMEFHHKDLKQCRKIRENELLKIEKTRVSNQKELGDLKTKYETDELVLECLLHNI